MAHQLRLQFLLKCSSSFQNPNFRASAPLRLCVRSIWDFVLSFISAICVMLGLNSVPSTCRADFVLSKLYAKAGLNSDSDLT